MKLIDNRIALVKGSSISIYNQKNYSLDEEIKVNEKTEINCLFQIKNENLICGTNLGEIIIYKYDHDSEEYVKESTKMNQSEIFKIDKFCEGFICALSKNGITIYDEIYFDEKFFQLKKLYFDFVYFLDYQLAMLNENCLDIIKIDEKQPNFITSSQKIEVKIKKNVLTKTNKYLIVGGIKELYILDYSLKIIQTIKIQDYGNINYIHKIHDELFLASTDDGEILQITNKNKNHNFKIAGKRFISRRIYSLVLNNINTILFTYDDGFQILTKKEDNCNII
jgi:hypothetical protein